LERLESCGDAEAGHEHTEIGGGAESGHEQAAARKSATIPAGDGQRSSRRWRSLICVCAVLKRKRKDNVVVGPAMWSTPFLPSRSAWRAVEAGD
jgi:hypothetical protein